jgi:WD40 repeat protein
LAISFFDKVKIYHLLDSDIREYRVLDIKNQHLIKFSKGGQYLACVDQKDISIYFSYTLEKPKKYSHSGNISSLDFNDDDTIFTISSDLYGYI